MLTVLRQRNFALLWLGGLVSSAGDWLLLIALPFYVYQRTGSALATSAMFVAETVPGIALGSVAGVFVDRWDRQRTMMLADLARAVLIVLLLAVRSRDGIWVIYVVACAESSLSQFFWPAHGALLPRVVGESHLLAANALGALSNNLTRFIGPPLGGALLGVLGLSSLVLVDSASYLFSALMIVLLRVPAAPAQEANARGHPSGVAVWRSVWHDWREGLQLVRRDRLLTILLIVGGVVAVGQGIITPLLVVFVQAVLHGDAQAFGWLATAQGVGGLLGGVLIGFAGRVLPPARLLALSLMVLALLFLVTVTVPILLLALVLAALMGLPVVGWGVSTQTLLQGGVADHYRGRVLGALGAANSLLLVMGMVLASGLTDRLGIVPMLDTAASLYLVAGLLALALLPKDRRGRRARKSRVDQAATPVAVPRSVTRHSGCTDEENAAQAPQEKHWP